MYTFSFHKMKTIFSYSIATGFGSGYSKYMPGTIGTIWAWIMFLILDYLFIDIVLFIIILTTFVVGILTSGFVENHLNPVMELSFSDLKNLIIENINITANSTMKKKGSKRAFDSILHSYGVDHNNISTKNMNFLVIDRKGIGNNLVIHNFKNEKISLKYK